MPMLLLLRAIDVYAVFAVISPIFADAAALPRRYMLLSITMLRAMPLILPLTPLHALLLICAADATRAELLRCCCCRFTLLP